MAVHAETYRALEPAQEARLPMLPVRILQLFYAPGRLFTALRARPVWGGAVLVGALAVGASFFLIPVEMWEQSIREQMLRSGRALPEGFEFGGWGRIAGTVGGAFFWLVLGFFQAGVLTVVFHFFLGDEARYTQYLSVVVHAQLIAAIGALVIVPLKLAQADPQLTLNLGLFVPAEGGSYPLRVLRMLDLFMIWSFGAMAVGVSKLDPRRSWGSAASVLFVFLICLVMVLAIFAPAL